ncbi:MATE family efflux transporter [Streptomyces prunicolor]|uniref:MATE family efflux transporter n=1 Tax=Streptomyces prunicolor TaxID=67348 RepID=UPI003868F44F|nr:MATE family efflux transporter [Streptomyces prunicolor]
MSTAPDAVEPVSRGGRLRQQARPLLELALPAVLATSVSRAGDLISLALTGHYSSTALAGVAGAIVVVELALGVLLAGVTGYQVLCARHLGAGERPAAVRALHASLRPVGALAVLAALVLVFAARPLVALTVHDPAAVAAGAAYLRARAPGLPLAVLSAVGTITLQAAKRTRLTLLTNCVAMPVNLLVSWALIYGIGPLPALGAAGNGLGVTLSLLCAGALQVVLLRRAGLWDWLGTWRTTSWDRQSARASWELAWPAMVSMAVDYLASFAFFAAIGLLSLTELAASRVVFQLVLLVFMLSNAFSGAAGVLMSRAAGGGCPDAVRDHWRANRVLVTGALTVAAGGLAVAVRPVLRLFTGDPAVVSAAVDATLLVAASLPLVAVTVSNTAALRALRNTRADMVANTVASWVVQLPLAWVAVRVGWGLTGAFGGVLGYWVVRAAVTEWAVRQMLGPGARA